MHMLMRVTSFVSKETVCIESARFLLHASKDSTKSLTPESLSKKYLTTKSKHMLVKNTHISNLLSKQQLKIIQSESLL